MRLASVLRKIPSNKDRTLEVNQQPVSRNDLLSLERYLDDLWRKVGIDVEFPKHFFERLNDERNKRQITVGELRNLFSNAFRKYADVFSKIKDFEGVLKSFSTAINIPFALDFDFKTGILNLVAKTIMRKKDFKTPDKTFVVESK